MQTGHLLAVKREVQLDVRIDAAELMLKDNSSVCINLV